MYIFRHNTRSLRRSFGLWKASVPVKPWMQALIVASMAVSFHLSAFAYTSSLPLYHGPRTSCRQAASSKCRHAFAYLTLARRQWSNHDRSFWKKPKISTFHLPHHSRMMNSAAFDGNGSTSSTRLDALHHSHREPDWVEMLIGGERYSLVPMPERMKATTLFVGNLCEFVRDADLSKLFSQVSSLVTVPSCVVRKVDTQSTGYGFVSFPSVKEKEDAILRFHNSEWRGKRLKVECIREDSGAVRIPEYMVEYVIGRSKRASPRSNDSNNSPVAIRRISRDDVERLSRGQPSKRRGYGSRNVPHRLNEEEREELERAARKGYLTLLGGGNRRTRKGSPLKNIHRQWCDARDRPQILLYKAVGGKAVDELIVDLSPLRLNGLFDDPSEADDFLVRWKAQILAEAHKSGMELREQSSLSWEEEECKTTSEDDEEDNDCVEEVDISKAYTVTLQNLDQQAWASNPIWQLPVVSLGIFEGERSKAKTMASNLAKLWDIPEVVTVNDVHSPFDAAAVNEKGPKSRRDAGARHGGYTKVKGLQEHRKRGGGHRQAW